MPTPSQKESFNSSIASATRRESNIGAQDPAQGEALLQLLALGRKDIEAGRVIAANEVFAELAQPDREIGLL